MSRFMPPSRGSKRHAAREGRPLCGADTFSLLVVGEAPKLSPHLAPYEAERIRRDMTSVSCARCLRIIAKAEGRA